MNYGEALEKAWKIIWRFKILWIFGLLASCAGGINTIPSTDYRFTTSELPLQFRFGQFPYDVFAFLRGIPAWVWILSGFGILTLLLLAFVIGLVGRTGVKLGAWRADAGAENLHFGQVFSDSLGYFWRMLGLTVLVGLPGLLFALIGLFLLFLGIFNMVSSQLPNGGIALICLVLPMFCLLIPLGWILSVLGELSSAALISENLGVFASIGRGWRLMWAKIGSAILISLLLFVFQIVAGILLGIPAALLIIPFAAAAVVSRAGIVIGVGFVLLFLVIFLIGLFISSIFQSYSGSLWMVTFRRLTAAPVTPAMTEAPTPVAQ
jgi:hypothetical protein